MSATVKGTAISRENILEFGKLRRLFHLRLPTQILDMKGTVAAEMKEK